METTTTNPIETCEIPEGFTREEVRGLGTCLVKGWLQINFTKHWERLGGTGPFHVQGYDRKKNRKCNKWSDTLDNAVTLVRRLPS